MLCTESSMIVFYHWWGWKGNFVLRTSLLHENAFYAKDLDFKENYLFQFSPYVYCTKYDEKTGICEDGDACTYLHHNLGDTGESGGKKRKGKNRLGLLSAWWQRLKIKRLTIDANQSFPQILRQSLEKPDVIV